MYTSAPIPSRVTPMRPTVEPSMASPWLAWRVEAPAEPPRLTVAELAECRCPDLCDRDHDNE